MIRNNRGISKYLADAEHDANQTVMSANGRKYGTDGFIDKAYGFTNDVAPGSFFPADASTSPAAAANPQGLSQPYIMQIVNVSATQINSFPIWQANTYLDQSRFAWSNGNLTISGVTISLLSAPSGTTQSYYTALQQSITNNFTCGKTYLYSSAGASGQLYQPLGIQTFDTNGNMASKILPTALDPYQFQATAVENLFAYRVDGNTLVTINVLASVTFQIWFYPSYTINLARGLGDDPIGRGYAAPPLGSPRPVKMVTN